MSAKSLDACKDNREALLRAELAAWLHDMGKCADAFLAPGGQGFKTASCKRKSRVNPHKAVFQLGELKNFSWWQELDEKGGQCQRKEEAEHDTALWRTVQRLGQDLSPLDEPVKIEGLGEATGRELILWGRPLVADNYDAFSFRLGDLVPVAALLGWAHKVAHMEKEEKHERKKDAHERKKDARVGKENIADGGDATARIASPFGFESPGEVLRELDTKLSSVLGSLGGSRDEFLRCTSKSFRKAPGDTRRPINEVTLWDWSFIVAALFKAELARFTLMREERRPEAVAWRLLSVRTDGLGYFLSANTIPDLLARKRVLTEGWDRVKTLLEETYPIGLEVYRDENGPVFVVPDIKDLVDTVAKSQGWGLGRHIRASFAGEAGRWSVEGDIVPALHLDCEPWKGQPAPDALPPVGEHIARTPSPTAEWHRVEADWAHRHADTCSVCGLRPIGPGRKATDRNVCDICEQRRADRAQAWANSRLYRTIWVGEVADANGRLALVSGRFDLRHWMDGTLVRSLAFRDPQGATAMTADEVAKNPSFARLRRIWETTRTFWQEVCPADEEDQWTVNSIPFKDSLASGVVHSLPSRLALSVSLRDPSGLGPYHAYDLPIPGGPRASVLWDEGRLILIDNLLYLARQMDDRIGTWDEAIDRLRARLEGAGLSVEEPGGYGARRKVVNTATVTSVEPIGTRYSPVVPLLAEPQMFMALVPAQSALAMVQAIKAKYEREMGKVRNRLPLHLGVIFAPRRTPFRAVLDAGRQMARYKAPVEVWTVVRVVADSPGSLPRRLQGDSSGQFERWMEVVLEREGRSVRWTVPAVMGDGKTEDVWYPYVFLQSSDEPKGRARYFRAQNPWNDRHPWLVHAGSLEAGDQVYFTPSTFDFEFLDTAGRRFDVDYDENGRRSARPVRPYLLDDVDRLERFWGHLRHLSVTQRHHVIRAIEATRETWFGRDEGQASWRDEVFGRFVADTLAGATWPKAHPGFGIDATERDALIRAGVRGDLTDLAEIHIEILKEKD